MMLIALTWNIIVSRCSDVMAGESITENIHQLQY